MNMNTLIDGIWPDGSAAKIITFVANLDSGPISTFTNFILETITRSDASRYQVSEGYNDFIVTNYGNRPITCKLSGKLYDRFPMDQRDLWDIEYNKYFKLSQVAKYGYTNYLVLKKRCYTFVALSNVIRLSTRPQNMAEFMMDILVIDANATVGVTS